MKKKMFHLLLEKSKLPGGVEENQLFVDVTMAGGGGFSCRGRGWERCVG